MYAGATNSGAPPPETAPLADMLRRFIEPILALRKLRRGAPRQMPGAVAPAETPEIAPSTGESTTGAAVASDGYMEARREWSERYGDYSQQVHHWRLLAVVSGLVTLIAIAGMAYIGTRSKVGAYIVDVSKPEAVAAAAEDRTEPVDARMLKAYLARFIVDWRTVTVDRQAQKVAIDRVYSMLPTASVALRKLNAHYKTYNPFALAASESVNVSIISVLAIAQNTWQVEWTEQTRDPLGAIQKRVRLKAAISVGITPPTQESLMLVNPLGIYVTDLN